MEHLSRERLLAGLGQIRGSPQDGDGLVLIVRRPAAGERDLPPEAALDQAAGLAGDNWLTRGSTSTPDGSADPRRQVTVMNARVAELVAGETGRMPLAGDQRFGAEAMRFVDSRAGRQLRLRGMNARVVVSGTVRLGDLAVKAPARLER